jgi:arginine repressor
MHECVVDLLVHRDELRLEELVFEFWCEFDMTVSQSTVSRMLKQEQLKSKVYTRTAHHHSVVKQGIYEEQLAQLMARGHEIRVDPMEMRVYLDG